MVFKLDIYHKGMVVCFLIAIVLNYLFIEASQWRSTITRIQIKSLGCLE